MSNLKQATLNEHVNLEAIEAFAGKLKRDGEDIVSHAWLRDQTPAEADALSALSNAEAAMRLAFKLSCEAQQKAHIVFYARIYGKSSTT